jgi:thiol-disulfide isomerase/thioredoxin
MTATETIQIPLGFTAPNFKLFDPISKTHKTLEDFKSDKAVVIAFICNHCPFVKHIIHEFIDIANEYIPQGISFVAINSNDVENYPEDGPEKMKEWATKLKFPFSYLYDETQRVAKNYSTACTPDFNIFDENLKCIYRGRLDGSSPGNGINVSGNDIRNALDAVVANKEVSKDQHPSLGCSVKWKSE